MRIGLRKFDGDPSLANGRGKLSRAKNLLATFRMLSRAPVGKANVGAPNGDGRVLDL
jgi:hypothetical protein